MSKRETVIVLGFMVWLSYRPEYGEKLRSYFQRLNPVTQTAGQWTTGKQVSVSHSFIFSKGSLRHIFYETEYDTSGNVTQFTPYRIEVWPPFDGPIKKN